MAILIEPVEAAKYNFLALPIKERWGLIMSKMVPEARLKTIDQATLTKLPLIIGHRSIVQDDLAETVNLKRDDLNVKVTINLPSVSKDLLLTGEYYHLGIEGVFKQFHDQRLTFVPLNPLIVSGHLLVWKSNKYFQILQRLFYKQSIIQSLKKTSLVLAFEKVVWYNRNENNLEKRMLDTC